MKQAYRKHKSRQPPIIRIEGFALKRLKCILKIASTIGETCIFSCLLLREDTCSHLNDSKPRRQM